ncbi:MAG: hypothetical protein SNJ69_15905 [Chloroflexaceae bacterium]
MRHVVGHASLRVRRNAPDAPIKDGCAAAPSHVCPAYPGMAGAPGNPGARRFIYAG